MVVDVLGDHVVVASSAAWVELHRPLVEAALLRALGPCPSRVSGNHVVLVSSAEWVELHRPLIKAARSRALGPCPSRVSDAAPGGEGLPAAGSRCCDSKSQSQSKCCCQPLI